MRWSRWIFLADYTGYEPCNYDGPGCYELAIGGPRGGNLVIKYIGETSNISRRMRDYGHGAGGSHHAARIFMELRGGKSIFYRFIKTNSKIEAKKLQDLFKNNNPEKYPWND